MTPPPIDPAPLPDLQNRDRTLSDRAYERILAKIMEGEFSVGEKLPAEHDLSRQLGVSRPVLRTALKQLRNDNVIVSKQGSGSFVNRRPEGGLMDFAPVGSIADIQSTFEFREALEGKAAALAATRRSDAELARLRAILDEWDMSNNSGNLGVSADEDFHAVICSASRNQYFMAARVSMRTNILAGMNLTITLTVNDPEERIKRVKAEHMAIFEAIAAKDPDAAGAAMRAHIDASRNRVFEGS